MNPAPPPILAPADPPKTGGVSPWWLAGGCALLFATSLALPALHWDDGAEWLGAEVFGIGWMGVFVGQFGWSANLFWLLAMIFLLLRLRITTLVFTLLAVVAGCTSFTLIGAEIPMDEAGVKHSTVTAFGPAFYVWFAALAAPGFTVWWARRRS